MEEILNGTRLNEIINVLLAQDESDRLTQYTEKN